MYDHLLLTDKFGLAVLLAIPLEFDDEQGQIIQRHTLQQIALIGTAGHGILNHLPNGLLECFMHAQSGTALMAPRSSSFTFKRYQPRQLRHCRRAYFPTNE